MAFILESFQSSWATNLPNPNKPDCWSGLPRPIVPVPKIIQNALIYALNVINWHCSAITVKSGALRSPNLWARNKRLDGKEVMSDQGSKSDSTRPSRGTSAAAPDDSVSSNSEPKSQSDGRGKPNRRSVLKTAVAGAAMGMAGQTKPVAAEERRDRLFQIGGQPKSAKQLTPLMQRAADDYRRSHARFGGQLSSPIRELFLTAKDENRIHFGVVVIGSGYGASITAAKLSQKLRDGNRICIVERGKEWIPGTYRDEFPKVLANSRSVLAGPTKGQLIQPLGLFNIQMNDEVNILSGNGARRRFTSKCKYCAASAARDLSARTLAGSVEADGNVGALLRPSRESVELKPNSI